MRVRLVAYLGIVVVVALVAAVAWSNHRSGSGLQAVGPADPVPVYGSPERWTGPQGTTGQFVVTCTYSHSAFVDPIVHFGVARAGHRHDFYGSKAVGARSTGRSLVGTPTTCTRRTDSASYWQPTMFDHGAVVRPEEVAVYYRAAPGVPRAEVRAMPTGLAMIGGNADAQTPQAGDATGWTCGSASTLSDVPPTCDPTAPLRLVVTFPDCWDGVHLDSEDHHAHLRYSLGGRCPSTHPVHIPQLAASFKFPISGPGHVLTLASGSIYSAHADFLNGWDPAGLQHEIAQCINRGAVCNLATNREDSDLFQAVP